MLHACRIGLLGVFITVSSLAMAQQQLFLSALDDVPLMTGLNEAPEETVYFDTPAGRIVEAYAFGGLTQDSILTYYKDSLPALGWTRNAHGSYVREGEHLVVSVEMKGATAVVQFALSPNAR